MANAHLTKNKDDYQMQARRCGVIGFDCHVGPNRVMAKDDMVAPIDAMSDVRH